MPEYSIVGMRPAAQGLLRAPSSFPMRSNSLVDLSTVLRVYNKPS